jgi:lysine 2,3-aminomutase
MSRTLRDLDDLLSEGLIAADQAKALKPVAEQYAIALTPHLRSLISAPAALDPIARQFVPDEAEALRLETESADPIGDHNHEPVEGVIHRYPDRVLLKVVSVCPVYCRFCFRREMVGPGREPGLSPSGLEAALDYIRGTQTIWEVIVTGGDPFMLSPRRARELTDALEAIDHVKVVRWHTRMPVADPDRVSVEYARAISSRRKAVYVAVHVNHARELSPSSRAALSRLSEAGVALLSQSVLLKGVNNTLEALCDLMRALVECQVRPYYLHHPDLAPGTSHFRLSIEEGQDLVRRLRDEVSGLCQPDYVLDIPGGVSKALLSPPDVDLHADPARLRGRDGLWRIYSEE